MTIRQNLRRLKRARGPMKKANIIKHFFFFFWTRTLLFWCAKGSTWYMRECCRKTVRQHNLRATWLILLLLYNIWNNKVGHQVSWPIKVGLDLILDTRFGQSKLWIWVEAAGDGSEPHQGNKPYTLWTTDEKPQISEFFLF